MSVSFPKRFHNVAIHLFVLISLFSLAACGGGGSSALTLSTDATLSALTLSSGTLSPSFSAGTTSYSASVVSSVSSVTLSATSTNTHATIKVNGTAVASGAMAGPITLAIGTNTIDVVVTAQDGTTTKTYSITVTRPDPFTDATLSALSISSGTLSPLFSAGATSYSASVVSTVSSVTVNATTTNSNASVSVNSGAPTTGTNSTVIALAVGTNPISIVVTAQDGTTTKTYSISVTRPDPFTDATLSALSISSGSLSPVFFPSVTSYSDSVANSVSSVTLNATTTTTSATLTVNGVTVSSGTNSSAISLGVGSSSIPVVVTAQDGTTTKTYTITVKRLPALSALSLSNASLDQIFQSSLFSYTSTVNFLVNTIGVTATTNDSGDTLTIDNNNATSATLFSPVYLATGSNTVDTVVTSADATASQTYSIAITRNTLTNFVNSEQKWGLSSPAQNDDFGVSVAISGNTMVVGADQWYNATTTLNPGAAFVYTYDTSSASWVYRATLTAAKPTTGAFFGHSVAIDGNTIVVGAPNDGTARTNAGAAYVFTGSGNSWTQQNVLTASDALSGDKFGSSVSISGNTIVVGAYLHSGGEAYVFYNDGSGWSASTVMANQQILTGGLSDNFGKSVATDGTTIVVGAPLHPVSGVTTGAAYVFTGSGTSWTQQTILSESTGGLYGDKFGASVAVSGSTIAIGATGATGLSANTGAAYVFTGSGASWNQQAKVQASNGDAGDNFGNSIALSGERLVVGADQEDGDNTSTLTFPNENAQFAGAVYIYMRDSSNTWTQSVYLKASDAAAYNFFGASVGIDNDWLVTGATGKTISGVTSAGGGYAFQ